MVDNKLLKDLKNLQEKGSITAEPEDLSKIFEFFKQVAKEDNDIKEELEDFDIAVQGVITDIDKKLWIKIQDGSMDHGLGEIDNPSFTFFTTLKVGVGLFLDELDRTAAYMSGDFKVEGNLHDAMIILEIIELGLENLEDLLDDL